MDTPAPIPEVPAVEMLLQHLVAETQSRPPPAVSPPEPAGLEHMLRSFLSGQQQRQATAATATCPTRLERSGVFLMREVGSCSNTVPELGRVVPVYAARMAGRENSGGDLL